MQYSRKCSEDKLGVLLWQSKNCARRLFTMVNASACDLYCYNAC